MVISSLGLRGKIVQGDISALKCSAHLHTTLSLSYTHFSHFSYMSLTSSPTSSFKPHFHLLLLRRVVAPVTTIALGFSWIGVRLKYPNYSLIFTHWNPNLVWVGKSLIVVLWVWFGAFLWAYNLHKFWFVLIWVEQEVEGGVWIWIFPRTIWDVFYNLASTLFFCLGEF